MFKKFVKSFIEKGNVIRFELDDWYKWYKEPEKFHEAVVEYLTQEGKKVETLSIIKNITSNKVSELLIDGVKYELTVLAGSIAATAQTVVLRKID
ncbi:hypothetical protein [Fredinandcohnia onubensis]|uniref:hypothetical protein n=1 Tax=Fredinandcohnia onubensis TaxID=1571209 RepID=UPI000C0C0F10|nr:hypothetical protein [Fredinandcohnia onubensis]